MNFTGTTDKYFKAWNPNKEEEKKVQILLGCFIHKYTTTHLKCRVHTKEL